jgi:hypothetical protein
LAINWTLIGDYYIENKHVQMNVTYVEIEEHRDFLNQSPVVMIARIFNMLPVQNVKMVEIKT